MSYFKGKSVLITGGASGIGFKMGQKILERGAEALIIFDINDKNLEKAATQLSTQGFQDKVKTYRVDVRAPREIEKSAEDLKTTGITIDVLINNAGIVAGKPFEEQSLDEISNTMEVNSLGLMYMARVFLPQLKSGGSGYMVNIASAAGLSPNPGMTVYAGSKWAAVGWSESLKLEFEKENIPVKILTVMPGYIDTGMFEGVSAPRLIPLLNPDKITDKILDAVEKGKSRLREPFMVKLTPFVRGILPTPVYDFVAGKLFRVYDSMKTFRGREEE